MRVAAVQARPAWLDPAATAARVATWIALAAGAGARLVAFPETFLSGYPAWIRAGTGIGFEDPVQRAAYAAYLDAAVAADGPEMDVVCEAAARHDVFVFLGASERATSAGRGTVYCTLFAIHPRHGVVGAHRKLVPTHQERSVWGRGDGHGLRAHDWEGVRVSGLSCWENWMPQARHALYADGAEIHVCTWPGWRGQADDIARFMALEGRVAVVAASGLLSPDDVPDGFPLAARMRAEPARFTFDGGSAVAGPDGRFLAGPVGDREGLVVADVDPAAIRAARLAADPAGHYARPDVFRVEVDRRRATAADLRD